MRFLALFGLAAIASALPHQNDLHRGDAHDVSPSARNHSSPLNNGNGSVAGKPHESPDHFFKIKGGQKPKRDLQKKNLESLVDGVTSDASDLVDGNGTVTELVQNLVENLGDVLGTDNIGTLLDADVNVGKKDKRDLQSLLDGVTTDASALVDGNGSVAQLVDNLLTNLGDTLGIDDIGTLLDANVDVAKRTLGLANVDVSALLNLQGLLQKVQSLLSSGKVISEVDSLLAEIQSLLSELGLKKRSADIDLTAAVSIDQVQSLVDSLLGQVNGLLSDLGL